VVRYGKEHMQATRQRIIETAGRRLERDGIDGSEVATLDRSSRWAPELPMGTG
jgi:hypothetical protein